MRRMGLVSKLDPGLLLTAHYAVHAVWSLRWICASSSASGALCIGVHPYVGCQFIPGRSLCKGLKIYGNTRLILKTVQIIYIKYIVVWGHSETVCPHYDIFIIYYFLKKNEP